MIDILVLILFFAVLFFFSRTKISLIYSIGAVLFYGGVILLYFHVSKNGGKFTPLFPDESTYINGTSLLLYAKFVSSLFDVTGPAFFRALNFLSYNIAMIIVLNRVKKIDYVSLFIVSLLIFGNYWNFFILKEGLTVLGITLMLLSIEKHKKFLLFISSFILVLARPEAIALIIYAFICSRVYNTSKAKFIIINVIAAAIMIYFFSLDISQPVKLSFISRRMEDVYKSYDKETLAVSNLPAIQFFFSSIYIETVVVNFKRAFSVFYNSKGLATLLVLINFTGLFVFIFSKWKNKVNVIGFYFLFCNLALVLSHNTYRYANAIIIPYLLIYILERHLENTYNESK
ncbi:hypothetical protein D6L40_08775 [Vibrio alginolyticus]|uniref:hypothetical protein n=1 Tax=Vibrio TaxID=662 RepID=UPI001880A26A|nr:MULTISPECIES: hypothetical protein [Vibrio]EGR1571580.1 hypothetical protein [Vibrio alginolyticus]EGX6961937.1 hypothetical protein [Vibrio alginolyticus]EJX2553841.1 hypothetical protein [Vibrio alginolyticus]ELA6661251.1 hypothetical protein [Vibrio alginolyticus]MBE8573569.1 hypothetical protein [Vibrio sp. OPT46]